LKEPKLLTPFAEKVLPKLVVLLSKNSAIFALASSVFNACPDPQTKTTVNCGGRGVTGVLLVGYNGYR
jgi:hypothetical protein